MVHIWMLYEYIVINITYKMLQSIYKIWKMCTLTLLSCKTTTFPQLSDNKIMSISAVDVVGQQVYRIGAPCLDGQQYSVCYTQIKSNDVMSGPNFILCLLLCNIRLILFIFKSSKCLQHQKLVCHDKRSFDRKNVFYS